MKKYFLPLAAIVILSCGPSKVVKQSEKTLKGNWLLERVSSTVVGELNFEIFNTASRQCMIESTWEFIPNNNTGSYLLSGDNCDIEKNYFVFTVDEVDSTPGFYDFLLKPTNKQGKSDTNKGFRLEIISLTETSMAWKQTISFEGKPQTLTFNFNKI